MKRKVPPTPAEAIAIVQAIYQELAKRPIERDCTRQTECCKFKLTGRTPYLTKGEAFAAASALRASGRRELPARNDGACPMLGADGRCLIYTGRPMGCRTHFCAAAGGPYARREVSDLIHKLEDLDVNLGGSGSMPLPTAVKQALREIA